MLIDTHAHLSWPEFAADLPTVLDRAKAAGVSRIVSIAADLESARQTLAIADQHDRVHAVVGIHPGDVNESSLGQMPTIRALANHPKVVGIGETGLDYYREARDDHKIRRQQQDLFQAHLALSKDLRLPVVIHNRESDADLSAMVRTHAATLRSDRCPWGIMHSFAGDAALAAACIEAGLLISFSGILTFRNAEAMRDVARQVPLDHLLIETDAPYLAPVPHRGKRNEPAFVAETAAMLAAVKGVTVDEIATATSANAMQLFGFDRRQPET